MFVGATCSTDVELDSVSRIVPLIRDGCRTLNLLPLNQQRSRFEHAAFRLVPQFGGIFVLSTIMRSIHFYWSTKHSF